MIKRILSSVLVLSLLFSEVPLAESAPLKEADTALEETHKEQLEAASGSAIQSVSKNAMSQMGLVNDYVVEAFPVAPTGRIPADSIPSKYIPDSRKLPAPQTYDEASSWAAAICETLRTTCLSNQGINFDANQINNFLYGQDRSIYNHYGDISKDRVIASDQKKGNFPTAVWGLATGYSLKDYSQKFHLKDAQFINMSKKDDIKYGVHNYGAVLTKIYRDDSFFKKNDGDGYPYAYRSEEKEGGSGVYHAVTIVGWDDMYNENGDKFNPAATDHGAWLVRDITPIGEEYYYWVSYTDNYLMDNKNKGYALKAEKTKNNEHIYQYDGGSSNCTIFGQEGVLKAVNIYQLESEHERINSVGVGVYTAGGTIKISIYPKDQIKYNKETMELGTPLLTTAEIKVEDTGYITYDFNEDERKKLDLLGSKSDFAVEVTAKSNNKETYLLADRTYDTPGNDINYIAGFEKQQSYFSNGNTNLYWDFAQLPENSDYLGYTARIKVITEDRVTINTESKEVKEQQVWMHDLNENKRIEFYSALSGVRIDANWSIVSGTETAEIVEKDTQGSIITLKINKPGQVILRAETENNGNIDYTLMVKQLLINGNLNLCTKGTNKTSEITAEFLPQAAGEKAGVVFELKNPAEDGKYLKVENSDNKTAVLTAGEEAKMNIPVKATIAYTNEADGTAPQNSLIFYVNCKTVPEKITINFNETLHANETKKISALVEPSNASQKVIWSSSNPDIACVYENQETGETSIVGLASGTVTITARSAEESSIFAAKKIVVKDTVQGVLLNESSLNLDRSAKKTLKVSILPISLKDETITWKIIADNGENITGTTKSGKTTSENKILTIKDLLTFDMEKGTITAVGMHETAKSAVIYASCGGKRDYCRVKINIPLEAINLSLNRDMDTIKLPFSPEEAPVELITEKVPANADGWITYQSSMPSVVSVDENGKLDIKSKGTAIITAQSSNGIKAELSVKAGLKKEYGAINFHETFGVLYSGGTGLYGTANTPYPSQGKLEVFALPLDVNDDTDIEIPASDIIWSSDNTDAAAVDKDGLVTAVGAGTAVIKAQDKYDTGKYVSLTVKIEQLAQTLEADFPNLELALGKSLPVKIKVLPESTSDSSIEWSSNAPSVAEVDESGNIKAISAGNAVITAKAKLGGKTATIAVKVMPNEVSKININSDKTILYVNGSTAEKTVKLKCTAEGSGENTKDTVGQLFSYFSSDETVVKVEKDGTVTAAGNGEADITVKAMDGSNVTAVCKFTVKTLAEQVKVRQKYISLKPDDSIQLYAGFLPETTTETGVFWDITEVNGQPVNSAEPLTEAEGITVDNAAGKVKSSQALTGTKIKLRCKAAVGGKEDFCFITIVSEYAEGLKFTKSKLELTGVGDTWNLSTELVPEGFWKEELVWSTDNEEVAAVREDGVVSSTGFGVCQITAATKDGRVKADCEVKVYPIAKTESMSAVKTEYLESSEINPDSCSQLYIFTKKGELIDRNWFAYESSNEEVCKISETGEVKPAEKSGTAYVTARLKNDILKRKIKVKIVVADEAMVSDITISRITDKGEEPADGYAGIEFFKNKKLTFTAEAVNSTGKLMKLTKPKWKVSDSSMASVRTEKDGSVTVTLKKPGIFNLVCTSSDQWQHSESVSVYAYDITPVLSSKKAEYNKNCTLDTNGVLALRKKYGTEIKKITVINAQKGKKEIEPDNLEIKAVNGEHVLIASDLETGSYNLNLEIVVGLDEELCEIYQIDKELSQSIERIKVPLNVFDKDPAVKVTVPKMNLFQNAEKYDIKVQKDSNLKIKSITTVDSKRNGFANRFKCEINGDKIQMYALSGKDGGTSGQLGIEVEGYKRIVYKPCSVKTMTKAPAISIYQDDEMIKEIKLFKKEGESSEAKASFVLKQGDTELSSEEGYQIVLKEGYDSVFDLQYAGNAATITLKETMYKKYPCKLIVSNTALWNQDTEISINVTLDKKDRICLAAKKVDLNKSLINDAVILDYSTGYNNAEISGVKVLLNEKQLDEAAGMFKVNVRENKLLVSFNTNEAAETPNIGKYKLKIYPIYASGIEADTYSELEVNVVDKKAGVKISTKGSIDLVNREDTCLNMKIQPFATGRRIQSISLSDNRFCISGKENDWKLQAREDVLIKKQKYVLGLDIVLEDGTLLQKQVSFVPKESKVSLKKAGKFNLFKSSGHRQDLNSGIVQYTFEINKPAKAQILDVELDGYVSGFDIKVSGPTVKISLTDKGLKAKTYSIPFRIAIKDSGSNQEILQQLKIKIEE